MTLNGSSVRCLEFAVCSESRDVSVQLWVSPDLLLLIATTAFLSPPRDQRLANVPTPATFHPANFHAFHYTTVGRHGRLRISAFWPGQDWMFFFKPILGQFGIQQMLKILLLWTFKCRLFKCSFLDIMFYHKYRFEYIFCVQIRCFRTFLSSFLVELHLQLFSDIARSGKHAIVYDTTVKCNLIGLSPSLF